MNKIIMVAMTVAILGLGVTQAQAKGAMTLALITAATTPTNHTATDTLTNQVKAQASHR